MVRPGGFLITNEALPDKAASNLTNSLKTSVSIASNPPLTDYMFTYARPK
jgi:hypothetical protein